MIRQVNGKVLDKADGKILICLGPISIEVKSPQNVLDICALGDEVELWTHLAVSERGWDIFGFPDREELGMFEKLLSIPGVGPKSALSIMSLVSADDILRAVQSQNVQSLKLKGLGLKTAEKIISSLKGKVQSGSDMVDNEELQVYEALLRLGYKEIEIRSILPQIDSTLDSSEKIRQALTLLAK